MQGLKAELLRGFWYVAMPGHELKRGQMKPVKMLGEPVLVARGNDGKVFALRNICPHRGVQLHHGRFDGETVACSYHGWRYDRTGSCVDIPSMTAEQKIDRSRIRCGNFPCTERTGLIWVYFARQGEAPGGETAEPPAVPLFADTDRPFVYVGLDFPCSIDHTAYGLMDPAHIAFVHTSRWFRAKAHHLSEKTKSFEPDGLGFRMTRHVVPPTQTFYKLLGRRVTSTIALILPGLRIEEIEGDRHSVVAMSALTPIAADATRFHQMLFVTAGWAKAFVPLARTMTRHFLNQDRDIAVQQSGGLQYEPKLMLINDSNTQARWWMHLKDEWVNSGKEGRPFVNPLKPKTLRWMS